MHHATSAVSRARTLARSMSRLKAVIAPLVLAAAAACGSILDVDNPNNVSEDALGNPAAAGQLANGVLASTSRMLASITTPYATATDELIWTGSREAWRDLELGSVGDPFNEFSDQAFPYVAEARFIGDETIRRLTAFRDSGVLGDTLALGRAYLYTAVVYGTIADVFDNFVLGDRRESRPPVGAENMSQLYDTAVVYLDRALEIARVEGDVDLEYAILANRARTKHAKAVWQLLNPPGQTPASGLVNDAGANADAEAALALLSGPDDQFTIFSDLNSQPDITLFFEVNGRNEMAVDPTYATLRDPISGTADPVVAKRIADFRGAPIGTAPTSDATQQGTFVVVSDRELRLILAEAALAGGDIGAFAAQINAVRTIDNLPAYTPGAVDPLALLKYERRVNLWLQRRRLSDLYRFGEQVAQWQIVPNLPSAVTTPGLFFPITSTELQSNTFCADNSGAC